MCRESILLVMWKERGKRKEKPFDKSQPGLRQKRNLYWVVENRQLLLIQDTAEY